MRFEIVATEAQWQQARAIRQAVFVEEQDCPPEEEWDDFDAHSRHLLGYLGEEAVATARWRVVEKNGLEYAKLERFAVLRHARGSGLGRALVAFAIKDAQGAGHRRFHIHAQAYLEAFYQGFGFVSEGEPFSEAGIDHVAMERIDSVAREGTSG